MSRKWLEHRLRELAPSGKNKSGLAKALGIAPPRITEIIKGERTVKADEIRRMARYLEMTPDELLTLIGKESETFSVQSNLKATTPLTRVFVRGAVQAGEWVEATEWPRDDWSALEVPVDDSFASTPRFGLEVRGRSMEQDYPPGSVVICVSTFDIDYVPQDGDHVVVQRRAPNGLMEATVKELRLTGDDVWLWPKSSQPEHQQPLHLPSQGNNDHDEEVTITALVIGAYIPRKPRA